ncbi:MAG: hypothetical protein KAG19_08720 [Methylococcales bacterium]|nr:hypothetical protein [Methylococcales bacterium]
MKHTLFLYLTLSVCASAVFADPAITNVCDPKSATFDVLQQRLNLPMLSVNQQVTLSAQLDVLKTHDPFHFQLTGLQAVTPQDASANFQTSTQLLTISDLCVDGKDHYQAVLAAIPTSSPTQLLLKQATAPDSNIIYNWSLYDNQGAIYLPDRAAFDRLAATTPTSGLLGVHEVKFVMLDLDTSHPILFFMNSVETPFHYYFMRNVLKRYQDVNFNRGASQFLSDAYFSEDRIHITGSIIAYDQYNNPQSDEKEGVFTLEFWPTDPVPAYLIEKTYNTITAAMPFLSTQPAYHPVGDTHEQLLAGFKDKLVKKNIRIIHTDDLFAQLDSAALNQGEAYGRLKIISPGSANPSEDVIAIYTFIPNTLGHVGGIITEQPQTPLSHINLKARQNDTPNAYIKNARIDKMIAPLINQWVHYTVTDEGINIEKSTEAKALKWLEDKIPTEITVPESDLSQTKAMPLAELGFSDWLHVGVKAANVAEIDKILGDGIAPKGYALPFAMYDLFMSIPRCKEDMTKSCQQADSLSFYDYIATLLADESFNKEHDVRTTRLKALRQWIKKAEAPDDLINQIEKVREFWEPSGEPFKQKLRVRSSTNNEDLEGFNGAGLYSSFTHKPKEGTLIKSVQQVWSSLWNLRAFEERRLHRIDHLKTYMGVLIHPNYGDEQVNGVAITKNIYNPRWEGVYINAQYGELSITNPEPIESETGLINPIPDEFIVTRLPTTNNLFKWETLFIRRSNIEKVYDKPVTTVNVLKDKEVVELRKNLQTIHRHFKQLYRGGDDFSMDVEFKITETSDGSRGKLAIKQARPWID